MPVSATALCAVELVKHYPGGRGADPVRALDGLSVAAHAGDVVALLGRNGAGKSTTVKILTTLARADSGRASVGGIDVTAQPDRARHALGLVSQKSSSDPMATGRENLVLAGRIQGLPTSVARERAAELLDRFDLAQAADRLAKTYSGGMARKLDVAIGLVHRPAVLFLDEPTTGLDPEARAAMWAEIERLAADERMTVLLTTHYLDEADRLADRVAIVDAGRVVVEGTPDELKSELRGDAVLVDVVEPRAATGGSDGHNDSNATDQDRSAATVLDRLAGVRDIVVTGNRVRARVDSGARAVPLLLSALDDAGITVASVTVARPSLDDVYLRHVGRGIETQVPA